MSGRPAEDANAEVAANSDRAGQVEAGHYDYCDGNGAARLILAYLDQEQQER